MGYFTKENITFILALIGSIGTIAGWINHWWSTRKNLTLSLVGQQWNPKGILAYFLITNNSLQTISINDISILIEGKEFHCSAIPVKVLETTRRVGKEIIDRKEYYSMELPITLPALCGKSGYLNIEFDPEIHKSAPNSATFVIRTNRGRAMKKTLLLDKDLP